MAAVEAETKQPQEEEMAIKLYAMPSFFVSLSLFLLFRPFSFLTITFFQFHVRRGVLERLQRRP